MPVDPADAPHLALLRPWIDKANALIDDQIEAIAALAERSLTRAVVDAADGRPTWRALAGQRSAQAANKRLLALQKALAGDTKSSLTGLVQSARAKFYRQAFAHWSNLLPAAIIDSSVQPTPVGERKARGLIWRGKSPAQEIAPVFATAKSTLQTAMNAAAVKTIPAKQRHGLMDDWEKKTANAIKHQVEGMLSNSQIAITNLVGPGMIKGELKKETK